MAITFGGSTIVSDSQADTYCGSANLFEGDREDEYVGDSVPRGSGFAETWVSSVKKEHHVEVVWYTGNEDSLKNTISGYKDGVYRMLAAPTVSGQRSVGKCRLADIRWGRRQRGTKPDGSACYVLKATLKFIQAQVT